MTQAAELLPRERQGRAYFNIIGTDDLATQGAGLSAAMILT